MPASPSPSQIQADIKTRVLITSDTHGTKDTEHSSNLPPCDIAIHCGDLTDGSKLSEYQTTLRYISSLPAPLKLVIAGNHDFTLDRIAFRQKLADASQPLEEDLVAREYGTTDQVRALFESESAKSAGIVFLDEGMHRFTLANGAQLSVYASPFTPSLGQWGFQYHPDKGHTFAIDKEVDIAITHGPPRGVLDYTYGRERAGCPDLFAAVAEARPKIHCFGHIHEGWGAKTIAWKEDLGLHSGRPTHFTAIDNGNSKVVGTLAGLRIGKFDSEEDRAWKMERCEEIKGKGYMETSHCGDDGELDIVKRETTLFVNAALEGAEDRFEQVPWIIDVDLQLAPSRSGFGLELNSTSEKKRRKRPGGGPLGVEWNG